MSNLTADLCLNEPSDGNRSIPTMNWLDDRLPLYRFTWMDSGPNYHFAPHGRLCVLTIFLSAVIVAAISRSRGMVVFFGLLTAATFNEVPLELTALALLAGYFFWVLGLTLKKQKLSLPAVGFALTSLAFGKGYLKSDYFSPRNCLANFKTLATAVEMYGSDHHTPPAQFSQLQEGQYLRRLPTCRGLDYGLESDGQNYTLVCRAVHPSDQPQAPLAGVIAPRSKPPKSLPR